MFTSASLVLVGLGSAGLMTTATGHRRLTEVAARPRSARVSDIEMLVRSHGVAETKVWAVLDRVRDAFLDPVQVWSWVMAFDGAELADLCASDISDRELAVLIADRELPAFVH